MSACRGRSAIGDGVYGTTLRSALGHELADVVLDQVGVQGDGGRGSGPGSGDDVGTRVDDIAGSPHARHTGVAGQVEVTQPSAGTAQPRRSSPCYGPDVRPIPTIKARIWIAQRTLPEAADWAG